MQKEVKTGIVLRKADMKKLYIYGDGTKTKKWHSRHKLISLRKALRSTGQNVLLLDALQC